MALQCRRCPNKIDEGEVAHLVTRRTSPYRSAEDLEVCMVVCVDCLDVHERGFIPQIAREDARLFTANGVVPLPRMSNRQLEVLRLAAAGLVYRASQRTWAIDPVNGLTDVGNTVRTLRDADLALWQQVEASHERAKGDPTAYLILTDLGEQLLNHVTTAAE